MSAVSRETRERLDVYVDELTRWQKAVNLVSSKSLSEVWTRHVDDCLQVVDYVPPGTRSWLDMGAGGGLPGLVVAAARPEDHVFLVESDARKCAFLRSAASRMEVRCSILNARVEDVRLQTRPDVIMARGLAPLAKLLAYAAPWLEAGAVGLFLKGKAAEAELTEARECWTFTADLIRSRTDPGGRLCRVTGLRPRC